MTAKILVLDIETAPHIAYVWGAWKQNIHNSQWVSKSWIMSFSAKWLGEHEIFTEVCKTPEDEHKIIFELLLWLDEADFVVAHNGKKFDLPRIIGAAIKHGFTPPSPYKELDTLLVARREFGFVSNTLDALCEEMGLPRKDKHKKFPGFELWTACMDGVEEAWEELVEYNEQDVLILEQLYLRMRPYFRNHPNVNREHDDEVRCPKCGSNNIQWRGYYYTAAGLCYRRFVCLDCGGWGRARFSEKDRTNLGRNAT